MTNQTNATSESLASGAPLIKITRSVTEIS